MTLYYTIEKREYGRKVQNNKMITENKSNWLLFSFFSDGLSTRTRSEHTLRNFWEHMYGFVWVVYIICAHIVRKRSTCMMLYHSIRCIYYLMLFLYTRPHPSLLPQNKLLVGMMTYTICSLIGLILISTEVCFHQLIIIMQSFHIHLFLQRFLPQCSIENNYPSQ